MTNPTTIRQMQFRNMEKADLHRINMILSRAFTQGRIDDGFQQTQVPMCRYGFLEMYFDDAPRGCFVAEDGGQLVGASFSHVWGKTGWIGPLAVSPEKHLLGIGKILTMKSIEFIKSAGCRIIGLETNPISNRNLGFYSKLGFVPSTLMLDMMRRVSQNPEQRLSENHQIIFYSKCSPSNKDRFLSWVSQLTQSVAAQIDYGTLIRNITEYGYGDSVLFVRMNTPIIYMTIQTQPTSAEEHNSILRVIAFVAHPKIPELYFDFMLQDLDILASDKDLNQVLFRLPGTCYRALRLFLQHNFRIIHSDQRMVLNGYEEATDCNLFHFNRWV